jgi:circadian clock protein KaiC
MTEDRTGDGGTTPGGRGRLPLGADGSERGASVPKMATGVPGFDHVSMGGLPRRRATVVAGQAGSAKTVFAGHFLAEGVRRGQPGVFVTLEEPAADLRDNLATLGADVRAWEAADDWRFVDASPLVRSSDGPTVTAYSLEVLTAQIGQAVDVTGADRLVLDSLNAVMSLHEDPAVARQLLRRLISDLRAMGLTILLTVETAGDPGTTLSRYGIEEFVADTVVLLRNTLDGKFRRRTIEVLKMRGAMHLKGEVPFTVLPGRGVVVLPILEPAQTPNTFDERVSTGNAGLDQLTHGGWYRDASVLVSGPTGAGKTLMATEFVAGGLADGERVLLVSYEETREQVLRNARGWGHDLAAYEQQGLLQIVAVYPEVASLDDHLVALKDLVERFGPSRVAVDSLSALERIGSPSSYREFVIGWTSYVKQSGIAAFMTAASSSLVGGASVTDSHISALIDAIVLLRYVEVFGSVHRGIVVLKSRSSSHEHQIREFVIDGTGMQIGERFAATSGILTGHLVHAVDGG